MIDDDAAIELDKHRHCRIWSDKAWHVWLGLRLFSQSWLILAFFFYGTLNYVMGLLLYSFSYSYYYVWIMYVLDTCEKHWRMR